LVVVLIVILNIRCRYKKACKPIGLSQKAVWLSRLFGGKIGEEYANFGAAPMVHDFLLHDTAPGALLRLRAGAEFGLADRSMSAVAGAGQWGLVPPLFHSVRGRVECLQNMRLDIAAK
jgi:hypothetical protein